MLTKTYIKSRKAGKVVFELPESELPSELVVDSVFLAGDFNDWHIDATPMKFSKRRRSYRTVLELEPGLSLQFRYLINGRHWCNDWHADSYSSNGYGEDNCIVQVPSASEPA
jgi:hypothetical protein